MQERRLNPGTDRKPFARLAREAIEKHVREARGEQATWGAKPNLGWVRWPLERGGFVYLALRRHLNWVTGEVGISPEPSELERLELRAEPDPGTGHAWRVRLGHLLHDEDKWWMAGKSEKDLIQQLEWLALQTRLKMDAFLRGVG